MSAFTDLELAYLLDDKRLARIATVGKDGTPHVVPVGWRYDPDLDAIEVTGIDFAQSKKFRDVRRHGRAAIVIDDVVPPFRPRGVEIRGRAEALDGPPALIRIRPERIVSWGLESDVVGQRHARTVGAT